MTVIVPLLTWQDGPKDRGPIAPITIDFTVDDTWLVTLTGMFNESSVKANHCVIDNLANAQAFSTTFAGNVSITLVSYQRSTVHAPLNAIQVEFKFIGGTRGPVNLIFSQLSLDISDLVNYGSLSSGSIKMTGFSVYQTIGQSIPSGVSTRVQFPAALFNDNGAFDLATWQWIPGVGRLHLIGAIKWVVPVDAITQEIQFMRNNILMNSVIEPWSGAARQGMSASIIYDETSGAASWSLNVVQSSGVAKNLTGVQQDVYFMGINFSA